jgi:cytidylate kinase
MLKTPLTIAIDGTASSGKGTLSKMLASYFSLPYLNTGAIYRAVAFKIYQQDISSNITIDNFFLHLDYLCANLEVSHFENPAIFNENIGSIASIIAKNIQLRQYLLYWQQQFIVNAITSHNGVILDGRDTTTVIYPKAKHKFFVTANLNIRAERRQKQLSNLTFSDVFNQLKQRDLNDFNRNIAPLKVASDAFIIDNSHLDINHSFALVLSLINYTL